MAIESSGEFTRPPTVQKNQSAGTPPRDTGSPGVGQRCVPRNAVEQAGGDTGKRFKTGVV